MPLLPTLLFVLGVFHLLVGVPALVAPVRVRSALPDRYADSVGGRREWRGFGAGVTSVGVSLLLVANGLGA